MGNLYNFIDPEERKHIPWDKLKIVPVGYSADFDEYQYLGVQRPKFAMTFDQMRKIAEKNVWVDSAIRRVCDTMGSLDFQIVPEQRYIPVFLKDKTMQTAKVYLEELFRLQNGTFNDLSSTIKAVTRDLMIMDAGTIEIVRTRDSSENSKLGIRRTDRKGRVIGLVARDAAGIYIDHDEHQIHRRYIQVGLNARQILPFDDNNPIFTMDVSGSFVVFDRNDLIYMRLHPRSGSAYGTPPILTLLQSVQADLAADVNIARFMATGGVLPGYINVEENLDPSVTKRYSEAFKRMQRAGFRELPIISGAGKTEFIPIAANSREMEQNQLQNYYMKKILAIYGVPPHILGLTEGVNRGVAFAQSDTYMANAINPIKIYLENVLTNRVVHEVHPGLRFEFLEPRALDFDTKLQRTATLRQEGMISEEERYITMGYDPPTKQTPTMLAEELSLEQQKLNVESLKWSVELSKLQAAQLVQGLEMSAENSKMQKEQMAQQAQMAQQQQQQQSQEVLMSHMSKPHYSNAIQQAKQVQAMPSQAELQQHEQQMKKAMDMLEFVHGEDFLKGGFGSSALKSSGMKSYTGSTSLPSAKLRSTKMSDRENQALAPAGAFAHGDTKPIPVGTMSPLSTARKVALEQNVDNGADDRPLEASTNLVVKDKNRKKIENYYNDPSNVAKRVRKQGQSNPTKINPAGPAPDIMTGDS